MRDEYDANPRGFYNTAMALIAAYMILGEIACGIVAILFMWNCIHKIKKDDRC